MITLTSLSAILGGTGLVFVGQQRPSLTKMLERYGGMLIVAGLALMGVCLAGAEY